MIRSGKSAIDNQNFSFTFDRAFPLFLMNRNMTVDNTWAVAFQAKFFQNQLRRLFSFQQRIISIFHLSVSLLIFDQISFKGSHLTSAIERGSRSRPEKPENMFATFFFLIFHREKRLPHILLQYVIQLFPLIICPIDRDFHQCPIPVHRHTAVIEQIAIINFVKASLLKQKLHMLLQFLTVFKGTCQPFHYVLFFLCQSVWI